MKLIDSLFRTVASFYGYVDVDKLHDAEDRLEDLNRDYSDLAGYMKSLIPLEDWASHVGILSVRKEIKAEKSQVEYEVQVNLPRFIEVMDGMGLIVTQKPDIEIDITDQIKEPSPQSIDVGADGDWAGVPTPFNGPEPQQFHTHADGMVGTSPNCLPDEENELPYKPPALIEPTPIESTSLGDAIHNAGENAARAYEAKNEISDRFEPR